jgi:hypothetical protein
VKLREGKAKLRAGKAKLRNEVKMCALILLITSHASKIKNLIKRRKGTAAFGNFQIFPKDLT